MSSFQKALIREFAVAAADQICAKAIGSLSALRATLSGDDSGLENVWEEICVQVQGEESFYWEIYLKTMSDAVLGAIHELDLPTRDLSALWLQSEEGWDWHWDREWEEEQTERSNRTSFPEKVPFVLEDIACYVVNNHLKPKAEEFSNPNIDCHLEGGDPQEARRRRLIECMPLDTLVTELWDWDIRFEEESFEDLEAVAFCADEQLAEYAHCLAGDVERWINEYDIDYNQNGFENPEAYVKWIRGQCLEFMTKWRSNVKSEFGR